MADEKKKTALEIECESVRAGLLTLGEIVFESNKTPALFEEVPQEQVGEAHANLMLAYRHIEDARMRLGKVFQAINGGVSNTSR